MKNNLGFSLNIYIYGTQNFKKDIHEELKRSNIEYKLADNGLIQDINSLDALKELINDNIDDVFLIDDAKIIRENLLNSKIKFLKPKDGIEHEFLKEKGIEDISVDSIAGISKYILRKMKSLGLDDEEFDERDEIQDSITNIVNDAYNENSDESSINSDRIDYELSDDLKELLSASTENSDNNNISLENSEDNFLNGLLSLEEKVDNDKKYINIDDEYNNLINNKDEKMSNSNNTKEFFSLDDLEENDILKALGNQEISTTNSSKSNEVSIKLDNPQDIKDFLSKLLNSKALEITVKIKE